MYGVPRVQSPHPLIHSIINTKTMNSFSPCTPLLRLPTSGPIISCKPRPRPSKQAHNATSTAAAIFVGKQAG